MSSDFARHCQVVRPREIISPRTVTAVICRPTLHLLTPAERNRILDDLAERERAEHPDNRFHPTDHDYRPDSR
jgi:hypothetical protein